MIEKEGEKETGSGTTSRMAEIEVYNTRFFGIPGSRIKILRKSHRKFLGSDKAATQSLSINGRHLGVPVCHKPAFAETRIIVKNVLKLVI